MKKDGKITVRINKKLLEDAKENIPNISAFVEECLEQYLGYANGTYPTANDREILDKIGKLQVELFISNQNYDLDKERQKAESQKLNSTWFQLWNDFRKRLTVNERFMDEAVNVLGLDAEVLEDMLDFTYENMDSFGVDFTWEEVYERYEKEEK